MRLAIVIPTLNEARALGATLPALRGRAEEIWITDGGSTDATLRIAEAHGAHVVTGPPGRGGQLNRGARAASSEVLLFLHADTRLAPDSVENVRRAIAKGAIGGGFRIHYDEDHPMPRLANRLVDLRTRLTGNPLGDQAQFATREAFDALGGFREWPILEDLDFIRRLKRHGETALLDPPVSSSGRRVRNQGVLRSVVINWLIWILYFAGVSPYRLARLYRNIR